MSESDEFTVDITRQEDGDIVVAILGADVVGLMDDGQRLPLHSARCTMLDDDELHRFRDGIDRLLRGAPTEDDDQTIRVLDEVAEERQRQREKWGNDHDDWHTAVQQSPTNYLDVDADMWTWDRLHKQRHVKVEMAPDSTARRGQLVKACAVYTAEIEAIDRRNES